MNLPLQLSGVTQREVARWYKLKDIEVQLSLVHDQARIKVAPAGRRSGKTERAKRKLVKEALRNPGEIYFAAAPTHDQAKKIWWRDLKLMSFNTSLSSS